MAFIRDARYIDSIFAQYLQKNYIIIIIVAADIVYLIIFNSLLFGNPRSPFSFLLA